MVPSRPKVRLDGDVQHLTHGPAFGGGFGDGGSLLRRLPTLSEHLSHGQSGVLFLFGSRQRGLKPSLSTLKIEHRIPGADG
jgi:hypothetical protein